MAEFFCDVSAVGNEYQAYNDTPTTWGTPQDGNGKAGPGHAAAVAIATIDVAGCTASGTGTIGVLGVTVSSTLNASGAALATAIANAINAATTAVSSTYSANLLPLNRLVYARVNPGLNTQVQIMLRIAGADWNGMVPTQANISPAATIGAFASGADGPFGYLISSSALFGRAAGTYGAWVGASAGVTEPASTDCVHVRTRRSGVDLSASFVATTGTLTWRARNWLYDDGTIWSGNDGRLTVTIQNTNSGSAAMRLTATSPRVLHTSRKHGGLEVIAGATGNANSSVTLCYPAANTQFGFVNCVYSEMVGNLGGVMLLDESSANFSMLDASNSLLRFRGQSKISIRWVSASSSGRVSLNGLVVEVVAATGALQPIIQLPNTTSQNGFQVQWIGGRFYDTNGVYRCVNPCSFNAACIQVEMTIDGVAGITDPSIGWSASNPVGASKLVWSMPEGPNRGFRYETASFATDWKGDGTFPHCGAENFQGDAWSHRVTWGSLALGASAVLPLRLSFLNRAADDERTITLQLYVPDATTIYLDELEFSISYVDASDVWRTETIGGARSGQFGTSARTALPSSAKSWTANGVAAHSAKKLEITTAYQVKQNTELVGRLSLAASRSPAITFFASPQLEAA